MEKKFITREQKEKVSNRLVLNFGMVLAGALVLLYVFNLNGGGYGVAIQNVFLVLSIIFAVLAVVTFVLGKEKSPKLTKYAPICLGAFIVFGIVAATKFIANFTINKAVVIAYILMAAYFVIFAIYTGIYLKTHPVLVEKKKIQHKKKRK